MAIRDIVERARAERFTWVDYLIEDGNEVAFDADKEEGTETKLLLLPGLSPDELKEFERSLPAPPPREIRELLALTSGIELGADEVRFTAYNDWGYGFLLPHVVALNDDGLGNDWAIEVNPQNGAWKHVWFACHDPMVLVYQCETLEEYVEGVLDTHRFEKCAAGHRSIVQRLETAPVRGRKLPTAGALKDGDDPVLRRFADGLDGRTWVADLRSPKMGQGFDWSALRDGKRPVKRAGTELIFGIEPRPSLLSRLFGR